jgi:hypothetical protein
LSLADIKDSNNSIDASSKNKTELGYTNGDLIIIFKKGNKGIPA